MSSLPPVPDALSDQAFIARTVESCGNMVSGLGEHGLASSLWALASRIRATAAHGRRYVAETDGGQPEYVQALAECDDGDLRDALVLIGAEKRVRLRAFLEEAGR